jgi:hypothetical protein
MLILMPMAILLVTLLPMQQQLKSILSRISVVCNYMKLTQ